MSRVDASVNFTSTLLTPTTYPFDAYQVPFRRHTRAEISCHGLTRAEITFHGRVGFIDQSPERASWSQPAQISLSLSPSPSPSLSLSLSPSFPLPAPLLNWLVTAQRSAEAFLAHQFSTCTNPPSTKRRSSSLCSTQASK